MGLGAYVAGQEPMGGRVRIPNCGGRKSHKEWARRIPESPFDFWRGVTRILGVPLFFGVGALGRLGPSGTNTPLPLRTHFRAPCPVLGPLQHPGVGLWGNALRKQAAQKGLKGAWLSGGISALIGAEIGFEINPGGGHTGRAGRCPAFPVPAVIAPARAGPVPPPRPPRHVLHARDGRCPFKNLPPPICPYPPLRAVAPLRSPPRRQRWAPPPHAPRVPLPL